MERDMEDLIRAFQEHDEENLRVSVGQVSQVARTSASELPFRRPFVDPLWHQGYRVPFQEHRPPYLLERWDTGRAYKLVVYRGGGIYESEDVNDPLWKEMLALAFRGEKPTIVFTSEDWFKLRINNPTGNIGDFSQLLSPEEAPKGKDDWYEFTVNYVPPVPVPVFKGTRIILENGRAGKVMFIRTYRRAPYRWYTYLRASSERYRGMGCR